MRDVAGRNQRVRFGKVSAGAAPRDVVGEDYEAAHVPPRAQAVLTDFDERSAHYDVLDRREQPM